MVVDDEGRGGGGEKEGGGEIQISASGSPSWRDL